MARPQWIQWGHTNFIFLPRGHFGEGAFWGHTSFDDRFDNESGVSPLLSLELFYYRYDNIVSLFSS